MEYTVVCRLDLGDLIQAVEQKLREGWVTAGGVAVVVHPEEERRRVTPGQVQTRYYQALTLPVP